MTTEEIRRLASKATPGPWRHISGRLRPQFSTRINEVSAEDSPVCGWPGFDDCERTYKQHKANAAYIAAVDPTTILSLLAKLDSAVAAYREERESNCLIPKVMANGGEPFKSERAAYVAETDCRVAEILATKG